MRRVVVTGMGIVSPLGVGVAHVWNRLIRGESGIRRIESFPTEDFSTKIAGLVPHGDGVGELDFDNLFSVADRKRNGSFILYAMAAGDEALKDSGLDLSDGVL